LVQSNVAPWTAAFAAAENNPRKSAFSGRCKSGVGFRAVRTGPRLMCMLAISITARLIVFKSSGSSDIRIPAAAAAPRQADI